MHLTISTTKQHELIYGDMRINYERGLRYSDVSRILIKVHPDCRVVVLAPSGASNEDVLSALKKRSRWIYSKIKLFQSNQENVMSRRYISGENHYYLGRQHLLKIIQSTDEPQQVKWLRGKLEITVQKKSSAIIKQLLHDWYNDRAKEIFQQRLAALLPKIPWVKQVPPMRLFNMKKQWGSCSPQGRLTLNPHLIKAPRECIDYVILHELCHIAEHNHSAKFYRLLERAMPSWEKVKDKLDSMAFFYLNDT